jgi:hypothetical protein
MEWLYAIALRVIAAVALIYFGLGLFNVNWLLRIRIIAALSAGALIVGAVGYPLVRPEDPLGAISLFTGEISMLHGVILIVLGFAAGVAGTLICYPFGRFLGPLSAPAGAAVLAMASGDMRQILLTNYAFQQRNAMYSFLRWELLFWLGICAAGYLGVLLTTKLMGTKTIITDDTLKPAGKSNYWVNCGIAAVAAAAIVYFTIGIFAQDIPQFDENLGAVMGHPGHRQIAFGVFVSVALAGFAAKQFLQVHYIPAILGASAVYILTYTKFIGSDTLAYMVKTHSICFFTNSIFAILPIQFAPFAVLGAITGFWISIFMKYRPKHTE